MLPEENPLRNRFDRCARAGLRPRLRTALRFQVETDLKKKEEGQKKPKWQKVALHFTVE